MSDQDGAESTGSLTPPRSVASQQLVQDLLARQAAFEERILDILGSTVLPQRTRTSDVGGYATPAEGSVENEPTDVPAPRPTSPTTAEAAIARHTVGFVPPPLPPSGVPPSVRQWLHSLLVHPAWNCLYLTLMRHLRRAVTLSH